MRKISLIALAVLAAASTSAHAGPTLTPADAAPAAQSPPVQPAPATQAAPATTILQTTNPQAQMVLKQLQAHGLVKAQPATTAPQPPVTQPATAPVTPAASVAKPVVHASSHHQTVEQKVRRIAARYGIHW
jgi:hypothetical protein